MKMHGPYAYAATQKPYTVAVDEAKIISWSKDDMWASFYKSIPLKKGDMFKLAPGGVILNGAFLERSSRPPKEMVYQVAWVAKRLRVAVFLDRDRIWTKRRPRKPTNRFGKPYWSVVDLRSYQIGCHESLDRAIKNLIWQCQATNFSADEDRAMGRKVVRWRCLLPKNEIREMEAKARKTGFILDGILVPPYPEKWRKGLEKLKLKKAAR